MLSLICGVLRETKQYVWVYIQYELNRNRLTDTENTLVATSGEGREEGQDRLRVKDLPKYYVQNKSHKDILYCAEI